MPDVTAVTSVSTLKLTNLRDVLDERAHDLTEWLDHLTHRISVADTFSLHGLLALHDALFELHGDLDDWRRFLSEQLGDDAE